MALDSVNNQVLVPAYGNGGFRAFQLDDEGLPVDRNARYVTSRESIYGRRSAPLPNAREAAFPGAGGIFDGTTERLFTIDRFANRILVHDAAEGRLAEFPSADFVIGQPDAGSVGRGIGPNRMGAISNAALDAQNQRLFVADAPNNRIMVFDVHPERLTNDPRAIAVIGQDDFESRDPGLGPAKLAGPSSIAYDPVNDRLFVSDVGNNRVLIFNADPRDPGAFDRAIAVMGQPDFESRAPRATLEDFKAESIDYDWRNARLFVAEDLEHRVMVYDAHPDRVGGPTKAIAVIGQPDAFSTHPAVSDTRVAMPRITVDSEKQKLYVSEGFPAGNRVSIWDIAPENLRTGMRAVDVIGHETPEGGPDFFNRMAQGHLDGRSLAAARDVTLDPVDHRLFVSDEYNHRVVIWQLDELNRIVDYEASSVLGQPDLNTSLMGAPSAYNMTVPLGAAYDSSTKRLFIGDGYHNRVLVYEAAPARLANGMAASIVIGQQDFESVVRRAGADGLNFGVRMGRGIASSFLPMGFAVDEAGQRLFVADGENNRVLIYDIRRDRLRNGAAAIGVIGQPDFESTAPGTGAGGLKDPGHMAYDKALERLFVIDSGNTRVLAFDVAADGFENGPEAVAVIGKRDFATRASVGSGSPLAAILGSQPAVNGESFVSANGIAHDPYRQLLYVSDGGGTFGVPADRILVFDVDPARLAPGTGAVATLGATSADARAAPSWGGAEPVPGQFTVRDTRGLDLDPINGRLFATGSFESRVLQFNFPRSAWRYTIAPDSAQRFATLDAVDLGGRADAAGVSTAHVVAAADAPGGIIVYRQSQPTVDARTQRHSRRLLGEAMLPASRAATRFTVHVDAAQDAPHVLYLYNPNRREARVEFTLRDDRGEAIESWARAVGPGRQVVLEVESATLESAAGTLAIDTRTPIALAALKRSTSPRGETVLSPAPVAEETSGRDEARAGTRTVVPYFTNGTGQRSTIVLINPSDDVMTGTVVFIDSLGERYAPGTRSDALRYTIAPRTSWTASSDGVGPILDAGYVLVEASDGVVPVAQIVTNYGLGGGGRHERLLRADNATRAPRFALDLRQTPVRHGVIEAELMIVNPDDAAAIAVLGLSGREPTAVRIPARQQVILNVRDHAGANAHGAVSVSSEAPLAVAMREIVRNIDAEMIDVGLPAVAQGAYFPYVPNGAGLSSELRLVNESEQARATGLIEFVSPAGEPATAMILR